MVDPLCKFMIGKLAIPDHPATVLNPNGREGFVIAEARRDNFGHLSFRGADTMWFGEGCILRFADWFDNPRASLSVDNEGIKHG